MTNPIVTLRNGQLAELTSASRSPIGDGFHIVGNILRRGSQIPEVTNDLWALTGAWAYGHQEHALDITAGLPEALKILNTVKKITP